MTQPAFIEAVDTTARTMGHNNFERIATVESSVGQFRQVQEQHTTAINELKERMESLEQKVDDGFEDLHGLLNQVLDRLPPRQQGDVPTDED